MEEREAADPGADLVADGGAVMLAVLAHNQVEMNKGSVEKPRSAWLFKVAWIASPASDLIGKRL